MGMQVAKQVPFIHVRSALVAYHLQFPIYHLPSSSGARRRRSFLVLLRFVRARKRRESERERREGPARTRDLDLLHSGTTFDSLVTPDADGRWSRAARIASVSWKRGARVGGGSFHGKCFLKRVQFLWRLEVGGSQTADFGGASGSGAALCLGCLDGGGRKGEKLGD